MKKVCVILAAFQFLFFTSLSQDIPPAAEQQLENLADVEQAEPEDDSYLQQLEQFRTNPINLNYAEINELSELRILTDLQIANLLSYRNIFGKLVNIYELQAIPTWDINTIRKLLPFVTVTSNVRLKDDFKDRFKNGGNSFLFRYSQTMEKANGFDKTSTGTKYLGDRSRLFFRYRYNYKNSFL